MDGTSPRWRQITPSQFAWEADALETLRGLLPDADPFQVWANFEFTDGGAIREADCLVVTPKGVYLIEVKSWTGQVRGDQGQWVQIRNDGSKLSVPNPAATNTAKVRSLASLVKRNWGNAPGQPRPPFIHSLVWFAKPDVRIDLPNELRGQVAVHDDNGGHGYPTISEAILTIGEEQSKDPSWRRITPEQSAAFVAAMGRIGFKEALRKRTVGSYELKLPAFAERGATQDFMATHTLTRSTARVRVYSNVADMDPSAARALKDAAHREFLTTRDLAVDGVVKALDVTQTDFGPAVVFEHPTDAVRLDQFMAERGDELDLPAALRMLERLTATVRELHKRSLTHRMLTPESVWLVPRPVRSSSSGEAKGPDAAAIEWVPFVSDLSLAARESGSVGTRVSTYARAGYLPVARTGAVEVVLADPAAETYLAPETFSDPDPRGVPLDIFSLGALAHLLITGRPPASDRADLRQALEPAGLSLAATVPGVAPEVDDLVRRATAPVVSDRFHSASDLAAAIELAVAAVTGDRSGTVVDPLVAEPGDVLDERFEVARRLGKGSTATALWCRDRRHDRDVVLKVSLGQACDERIRAEAEALANLKQQNVVELYELVELSGPSVGRPALVLSFAGERSLAGYLRDEGAATPEYLRRWGEDLLEAIRYLEKVGVAHRDVKPDNLGIVQMGPRKEPRLVLFDFSLSGAPAADLRAGTPPYLEPFLESQGRRFDLAAERYAAAVTLHELATGETPIWGDGQTDPSYLPPEVEATLVVEAMDPELRAPLEGFLARALRRDPAERFDTADDMARAWLEVFAGWEAEPDGDGGRGEGDDANRGRAGLALPEGLTLEDPIASLDTSRKVRSALRKLGAERVREVADLDTVLVNRTRGVAHKTRKQIVALRAAVLERFAEELAESGPSGPATTPAIPTEPGEVPEAPRPDLDRLGVHLVPPRGARGPKGKTAETVRALLGLLRPAGDDPGAANDWPTLSGVARQVGLTQGGVSQTFQKARAHWAASTDLQGVVDDLLVVLAELGGVAGVSELAGPLVDARGTGSEGPEGRTLGGAVVRAVLESSTPAAEVFEVRRLGRRTVVAVRGETLRAAWEDGTLDPNRFERDARHRLAGLDASALTDLAAALGRRADDLVGAGELVASSDALPALRVVAGVTGQTMSDARLVRLATAASDRAATNAASDLVPAQVRPDAALRWSRPVLIGARRLTVDELADRVAVRFPHVELPGRPGLDAAVADADLPYAWSPSEEAYVATAGTPGRVGTLSRMPSRLPTVYSAGGTTAEPVASPAVQAAEAVEARLEASRERGGFLALRVPTDRLRAARRELARFQSGPDALEVVDLEASFLAALRGEAARRGIPEANLPKLEAADDRASADWRRLSALAGPAVQATIDDVCQRERVLAWYPGALVRHGAEGERAPLDLLCEAARSGRHHLRLLWLVVFGGGAEARPTVDGTPVPVLGPGEWVDLAEAWLNNAHRAGGRTA